MGLMNMMQPPAMGAGQPPAAQGPPPGGPPPQQGGQQIEQALQTLAQAGAPMPLLQQVAAALKGGQGGPQGAPAAPGGVYG